jgi:hypothetical protein
MVKGWGGQDLLRSYEIERKPVATRNVAEATGNLQRMLTSRERLPPQQVFEPGAAGDAARAAYGAAYTEIMKREWFTLGIHLGYRYEGSPIVVPDGTPEPPDPVSSYTQTGRPGHRAPHVWLAKDRSTLDLFGRGFTLLRFGTTDGVALQEAAESRGVPLDTHEIDNHAAAALYGAKLVLVRPDGHVAWRGDAQPHEALRVIDTVRGAA